MDRATKAIKRGSIRLKSYSEINLILSDLNDMRSAGKTSVQAHQTFIEDLIRWANQESNEFIKNSFPFLTELNLLWTEIHNELFDNLKKFRLQFELILESEQAIDKARNNVLNCEQLETKLNKELKKSIERSVNFIETSKLEEKLREAKRASELAKLEVTQKEEENKINKLIRIKEGLKKLTESYTKLSQKCTMIMQAQKVVVNQLPDDTQSSNQDLQFTNECKMKQAIAKAKSLIQALNSSSNSAETNFPIEYDPPPPYSPHYGASTSSENRPNLPSGSCVSDSDGHCCNRQPQLNPTRRFVDYSGCSDQSLNYYCNRCSAQLTTDHRYVLNEHPDVSVTDRLQNTRISGRSWRRGWRARRQGWSSSFRRVPRERETSGNVNE